MNVINELVFHNVIIYRRYLNICSLSTIKFIHYLFDLTRSKEKIQTNQHCTLEQLKTKISK